MPYKKFRPLKQWGRYNTRIFKEILKARNKRNMPPFIAPEGIVIHDPLDPEFFKQIRQEQTNQSCSVQMLNNQNEVHPLYKDKECFIFEGKNSLTDGVDHICALIKAIKPLPLPMEKLEAILPNNLLPADFAQQLTDCILAGERFDPTLEKLPKKFDPVLFWVQQKRLYGTPVQKKNNIILENLCRKMELIYMRNKSGQSEYYRRDFDEPISAYLPTTQSGIGAPLVFRHQPHIILQTEHTITPLADTRTIVETSMAQVPDIYPISPLVDLETSNIYNDSAIVPRLANTHLNVNTLLWTREQNQKYPWTMEENAANAIGHCFGAALSQALRSTKLDFQNDDDENKILKKPIVTKAVQLVDGKMDLAIVQLNTLNLSNKQGIKNIVWLDKACQLYKHKPFHENMNEVEELSLNTAHKFISLLFYR